MHFLFGIKQKNCHISIPVGVHNEFSWWKLNGLKIIFLLEPNKNGRDCFVFHEKVVEHQYCQT